MDYNLLDANWIPVLYRDGRYARVGIYQAFEDAARIREIAASNPMDRVAIIRFLLAILYWCKGNPPDGQRADLDESVIGECLSKLEENRECFNLLGAGKRFYQDRNVNRNRAVTDLLQEVPAGNNFWHFRHSTDEINALCLPCCAMGLLRLPLFSVSGLPDLKSGINGTPPVYVIPLGTSVLETVSVNWVPRSTLGVPAWIQPDVNPIPDKEVPILTGLTLLSRRVFLHDVIKGAGVCIACGSSAQPLVLSCEFQSAGKQENDFWDDPHVIYSGDSARKTIKAPDLRASGKFKMDRPWPELLARLVETDKLGAGIGALLVVGFATNKALSIDVWEQTINMTSKGTNPGKAALLIRQWQKEGTGLVHKLFSEKEKSSSRKHPEILSVLTSIRPHVEDKVFAMARNFVSGEETIWEQAASEYHSILTSTSWSLSPGYTTSAVQYQRHISKQRPDMRIKTETLKKSGGKKGGNK